MTLHYLHKLRTGRTHIGKECSPQLHRHDHAQIMLSHLIYLHNRYTLLNVINILLIIALFWNEKTSIKCTASVDCLFLCVCIVKLLNST